MSSNNFISLRSSIVDRPGIPAGNHFCVFFFFFFFNLRALPTVSRDLTSVAG